MASRLFCCPERAFCSTLVPLCLFLSEIDRERCRETGTCFRLCSLEGVGVDARCGRRLRAAKCGRDGAHVGMIGDERRGIEMPKLMNAVPRQAVTTLVVKLKSQNSKPSSSSRRYKENHIAQRFTVKCIEECLCFLDGEDVFLPLLTIRQYDTRARAFFDHAHS